MDWRDVEGSQEVPLEALHCIVARDPPLSLALWRGLHDRETARVVSGVWVTSRHLRPNLWPQMQDVGCTLRERPLSGRLNNCVNFT